MILALSTAGFWFGSRWVPWASGSALGGLPGGLRSSLCRGSPKIKNPYMLQGPLNRQLGTYPTPGRAWSSKSLLRRSRFEQTATGGTLGCLIVLPGRKSSIAGVYMAPSDRKTPWKRWGAFPKGFAMGGGPLRLQKSTTSGPEALLSNLKYA